MNPTDLWRFRWRAISYFGAAGFPATAGVLVGALAKGPITGVDIAIAFLAGAGSGFAALKGLFDQTVDTTTPKP